MQEKNIIIAWFRKDLRLTDNPALHAAHAAGAILPIFIYDEQSVAKLGTASTWWLRQSLEKINATLDGKLNVYAGSPEKIIKQLAKKYLVKQVYFNTIFEPEQLAQDRILIKNLENYGISCTTFLAQLLWNPVTTVKDDGTAYKLFTPFYRNGCLKNNPPRIPFPIPKNMDIVQDLSNNTKIEHLPWPADLKSVSHLAQFWTPGEITAQKALQQFITHGLSGYARNRDFPDMDGTSRLSPHLHFGEISPYQIWHAITQAQVPDIDIACFLKQLGWREFSYNLLYHFPHLPEQNFQKKFDHFTWSTDQKSLLAAWQQGRTGYPIVDAGMQELAQTGYMHNRVRMIVASFLVKNLLIHWHDGRDWFWEKLVDADLANNSASWQWVAGCGVDAAPYFRIFNPILQGKKFDKHGHYTRKFVPELQALPDKYLYSPWLAPQQILQQAGIILGKDYPRPIIDLDTSRKKALAAYKNLSI